MFGAGMGFWFDVNLNCRNGIVIESMDGFY